VLLGQPYGNAVDWWSLGVVLYELFTGMNPFDAKDFDSVLSNILHSPINVPEYVPKDARDLIDKLLQRNPAKRMCSGPTGSDEIQNHPFFKSVEWKKLMVKQVKPVYKPKEEESYDPKLEDVDEPKGPKKDAKLDLENFNYVSKSVVNK
jgi:serum/glucocorticoid-regulated kinase 2